MTEAPLVSVILPVRNGGPWLAAAVGSILAQDFKSFELLLVDDHSTDGAVCQLSQDDQRLHILTARERGVVAAFNQGLAQARGAFIARMDADDIALPTRLGMQVEYLQNHASIGIAGARVELFPKKRLGQGSRRYQRWLNALIKPADIRRQLFIESPIPNPTALFRREVLEQLGGYRDCAWPEDYDLFLRADALGISMGKPEPLLLRWREHDGRLTRTDDRYAWRRFQQAKAHYLVRDRLAGRPVMIWGAGPSGRDLHDLLLAEGANIRGFVDLHPRRIGGQKRGLPVWALEYAATDHGCFIAIAVGSPCAREEIRGFLQQHEIEEGVDALFLA